MDPHIPYINRPTVQYFFSNKVTVNPEPWNLLALPAKDISLTNNNSLFILILMLFLKKVDCIP